jgi:hypothetical protein
MEPATRPLPLPPELLSARSNQRKVRYGANFAIAPSVCGKSKKNRLETQQRERVNFIGKSLTEKNEIFRSVWLDGDGNNGVY